MKKTILLVVLFAASVVALEAKEPVIDYTPTLQALTQAVSDLKATVGTLNENITAVKQENEALKTQVSELTKAMSADKGGASTSKALILSGTGELTFTVPAGKSWRVARIISDYEPTNYEYNTYGHKTKTTGYLFLSRVGDMVISDSMERHISSGDIYPAGCVVSTKFLVCSYYNNGDTTQYFQKPSENTKFIILIEEF